jgi:hypothetical protein
MLSRRGAQIVNVLLVALAMAAAISFVSTFIVAAFTSGFWTKWLRALVIAWVVAIPTGFFAIPLARRLTRSQA